MTVATTTETIPIAVSLVELATRAGVTRQTIYRWLRKRDLSVVGKSVLMSDIKVRWRPLYDSLLLRMETPACPDCGGPTHHQCGVCDFSTEK